MGYEGHTVITPTFAERKSLTGESVEMLIGTKHYLEQNGVPVKIVSGGGTGTYAITGTYPEMTEIQAGSYVFIDSSYRTVEGIGEAFGCALTMLTTVVSRPQPTRVIVDAGAKVLTSDSGTPQPVGIEGLEMRGLSEEHGNLTADPSVTLKPGDKIELLPTHCCTTVNLHDRYYAVRNGIVEDVWEIAARGKSQ